MDWRSNKLCVSRPMFGVPAEWQSEALPFEKALSVRHGIII